MSRISFGIAVVVGAAALVAPAAVATTPHLMVADTSPFTVRGTQFKPHERMKVTVTTSSGVGVHSLVASAAGGFLARFTSITLGTCASYTVRATGSLGSRATLRVVPECANGPTQ